MHISPKTLETLSIYGLNVTSCFSFKIYSIFNCSIFYYFFIWNSFIL